MELNYETFPTEDFLSVFEVAKLRHELELAISKVNVNEFTNYFNTLTLEELTKINVERVNYQELVKQEDFKNKTAKLFEHFRNKYGNENDYNDKYNCFVVGQCNYYDRSFCNNDECIYGNINTAFEGRIFDKYGPTGLVPFNYFIEPDEEDSKLLEEFYYEFNENEEGDNTNECWFMNRILFEDGTADSIVMRDDGWLANCSDNPKYYK